MSRSQASLSCKYCGESTRQHDLTEEDMAMMCAAYVAHLVESHWDILELGRAARLASGVPINDAWTRL
jgi:hypothetical protein